MCYKKFEEVKILVLDKNISRIIYDFVYVVLIIFMCVFYISVGVCCVVIFFVVIILVVLYFYSMKRIELDDSISVSSSF